MKTQYRRIGVISILGAMKLLDTTEEDIEIQGYLVNTKSLRYKIFKRDNMQCCGCGMEGAFFALEQDPHQPGGRAHFNLYGLTQEGEEVLITKDHLYPKSLGGDDSLDNLQTMCLPCNRTKGNNVPPDCQGS